MPNQWESFHSCFILNWNGFCNYSWYLMNTIYTICFYTICSQLMIRFWISFILNSFIHWTNLSLFHDKSSLRRMFYKNCFCNMQNIAFSHELWHKILFLLIETKFCFFIFKIWIVELFVCIIKSTNTISIEKKNCVSPFIQYIC